MGANDVCTPSEASMTPVATFQAEFEAAMATLASGLPDARIAITVRADLSPNGVINTTDVFQVLPPVLGSSCTV